MSRPAVTFTGPQVGLVAAAIAKALPMVWGADYEALDLMLDDAISGMGAALTQASADEIRALRQPPRDRFWELLCDRVPTDAPFTVSHAATVTGAPVQEAARLLAELEALTGDLSRAEVNGQPGYVLPSRVGA